jgi:hypothetical protein
MNGRIYKTPNAAINSFLIFLYNNNPSNEEVAVKIKYAFLEKPYQILKMISDKQKFLKNIDIEILLKLI